MKSLIDSYGRKHTYLRISVTDRCNLRCIYCMPPHGIDLKNKNDILTFDEIERVCNIFASMGVTKIRLTGGEPLVRKDIDQLIARLTRLHSIDTVGMTTNAVLLYQHIHKLKEAGLKKLNISLDTLRRERFEKIALRQYYDQVFVGIQSALEAGFIPLKLNVVVMKGINDDEILDFVQFAKDKPINVRFIEYMPFKFNQWNAGGFISFKEMKKKIEARYKLIPIAQEDHSVVAKDFAIEGCTGTVSFITSMSCDFCDTCNRIRLLADGSIKSCLFYSSEMNIRQALREGAADEELGEMIYSAVLRKPLRHPDMNDLVKIENRSMIEIGG